jgi:hypothetical protein
MLGISIKPTIGIGDGLQFSSVPENYFYHTGKKLVDVSRPWFFDYNPYVIRDQNPTHVREMWNFSPRQYDYPVLRPQKVYLSNAEIHASVLDVSVTLNRPRLYRFENYPYERRETILIQTMGKSHGGMPKHIVDHVKAKYGPSGRLFHIGPKPVDHGIPQLETPTLWDLAETISKSLMLICMDSGPSWIAACYPDVRVKKVRTKPTADYFKTWVPLAVDNVNSHWDDRCHEIFNPSEKDLGFTTSYRRI